MKKTIVLLLLPMFLFLYAPWSYAHHPGSHVLGFLVSLKPFVAPVLIGLSVCLGIFLLRTRSVR
mgnify:CR=1|jgi:hypothetical protein